MRERHGNAKKRTVHSDLLSKRGRKEKKIENGRHYQRDTGECVNSKAPSWERNKQQILEKKTVPFDFHNDDETWKRAQQTTARFVSVFSFSLSSHSRFFKENKYIYKESCVWDTERNIVKQYKKIMETYTEELHVR